MFYICHVQQNVLSFAIFKKPISEFFLELFTMSKDGYLSQQKDWTWLYIVIILGGLECRFYEHLQAPTWICIGETFVFQNNLHDTFVEESPCPQAYFVGLLLQAIELHRMHTMQHHKMCTTKTVPHYSLPKSSLLHSLGKGDSHMKISSTKKISLSDPSRPWCIAQKTTKTHLRKIKREAGGMFCRIFPTLLINSESLEV